MRGVLIILVAAALLAAPRAFAADARARVDNPSAKTIDLLLTKASDLR
jgi:hypothetical protein